MRVDIHTLGAVPRLCYAFWDGYLVSGPVPDGGFTFDGGYPFDFDAGFRDSGPGGLPTTFDGVPTWGGGGACGCSSAGAGLGLLAFLLRPKKRGSKR